MRNRFVRKLAATALAAALVLCSSVGVMGATMGDVNGNGVVETSDTYITLYKSIVMYNTEPATIYYPDITYSYNIAPVNVGDNTTVSNGSGGIVKVKAGIVNGATLSSDNIVFDNSESIETSSSGIEVKKPLTINVDLTKFNSAGIYRYVITETNNSDLTNAGISRPTGYENVRYLDVYIANAAEGGLEVKGYVCFDEGGEKCSGFVDASSDADKYYTYNVTVTKVVEGTLGDRGFGFDFAIKTEGKTNQPFKVEKTGTELSLSGDEGKIGEEFTVKLNHNAYVKLIGLPANTKMSQIQETNNSPDVYNTKIEIDGTVIGVEESLAAGTGVKKLTASKKITNYEDYNSTNLSQEATTFTVTNTLSEVSPTGLLFRYAPYVIMLGASVFLLAAMRRRSEDEE